MKVGIFNKSKPWQKERMSQLLEAAKIDFEFYDFPLNKTTAANVGSELVAASVFVDSAVDEECLAKLPALKFLNTQSTGYDHIDQEACRKRGVAVSYVPDYGEVTVAEYSFALLLALSRKIIEAGNQVRATGSFATDGLTGFDLQGKTLGVIGTGKIGRQVVRIARGFEMRVAAFDVHPDEAYARANGFEYLPLDDVLRESDIVTLHVPYLPETHHLLDEKTIRLMKQGAYLINTSRGGVVETAALVAALKDGRLGGAGLDVLEEEGVIKDELNFVTSGHPGEHNLATALMDHVLMELPNVVVTPHNAFNSREALTRILDTTVRNIQGFAAGQPTNLIKP